MSKINYYQWLNGNDCCEQPTDCDCHEMDCDCDEILLEISKLHTDDLILQDEIDAISAMTSGETISIDDALSSSSTNPVQNKVITTALNRKLDSSAYTPTDLSNYYTKQESDARFQPIGDYLTKASGDTIYQPIGNYLTKASGDTIYQPIGNYLTKASGDAIYQPIGDYAQTTTLIQYITNLQEQINSLYAQISGCCGQTGETHTRWVTMTGENDYWCSGTTKMSKEKEQSSTDGINWVDTGNVRSGSTILEEDCLDCGYVPPTPTKLKMWYRGGDFYSKECNSSTTLASIEDTRNTPYNYADVTQIEIGSCVTELAYDCRGTFEGMGSATSVTIPNSVTSIGSEAFYACSGLTSVIIPNSVTSIGNRAFFNCYALSSVTIGSGVTSIGYNAFQRCSGLTSMNIPNSVTSIGSGLCTSCSSISSVTIGNGVTSISDYAFDSCYALSSVTIGSSVTSIGIEAFNRCRSLTGVSIPDSVTTIKQSAFEYCSGLTSVTIGSGLTSIEHLAFSTCKNLTSVTIPSGVTTIGNMAFEGCGALTSVTCLATTPPEMGQYVFGNLKCPIYVPAESVDVYKAANGWSNYAGRIQAIQ